MRILPIPQDAERTGKVLPDWLRLSSLLSSSFRIGWNQSVILTLSMLTFFDILYGNSSLPNVNCISTQKQTSELGFPCMKCSPWCTQTLSTIFGNIWQQKKALCNALLLKQFPSEQRSSQHNHLPLQDTHSTISCSLVLCTSKVMLEQILPLAASLHASEEPLDLRANSI